MACERDEWRFIWVEANLRLCAPRVIRARHSSTLAAGSVVAPCRGGGGRACVSKAPCEATGALRWPPEPGERQEGLSEFQRWMRYLDIHAAQSVLTKLQ